jgi:hypothetical protein
MPKDTIRNLNPLSESEQFHLNRLLARLGENQSEALQRREKERDLEAKLQARRDKLAAEEARLSKRLAELRVDIDCVSAEIYKIAPSGVAYRHVASRLNEFRDLAQKQSFFNSPADTLDRSHLQLLAEICLSIFEMNTRPKGGKSLRERMEAANIPKIGPDVVGGGGPTDDRAVLAKRIVDAGRRRRGEID